MGTWMLENLDFILYLFSNIYFHLFKDLSAILITKYPISTALIMEKPVRSPMVPPIADIISINFAALSLVILSNVGVSK